MQLPFGEYITNILGIQSLLPAQFGAKPATEGVSSSWDHGSTNNVDGVSCDVFTQELPKTFTAGSADVRYVRDNVAVIPDHWTRSGGVGSSWLNIQSSRSEMAGCLQDLKSAEFITFDDAFFGFLGSSPEFKIAHSFPEDEQGRVHEAPVYVAETNELVFADTSIVGWLYALNVDTSEIRRITTNPPLHNVNGGTRNGNHIYLTTNGSPSPGIWKCSLPIHKSSATSNQDRATTLHHEQIQCTPLVNNYRSAHLNAPNDLIFTSKSHILFTDPNYGWDQEWPGVGPPELPTALYHFNTTSHALITLTNNDILAPNGLALSNDEKTLYVADSNSTSGRPINVWNASVRNVYAFDIDVTVPVLKNRRLVHVVEAGWPDGLRVTRGGLLLVASMGGVDVVDVNRGGLLIGKINVGDDVIFNLEPVGKEKRVWMLTGKKAVYKVRIAG